eukprot:8768530-Alexandrium_andersonii.AAC.1
MTSDNGGNLPGPPFNRGMQASQEGLPVLAEAELGNRWPGANPEELPALERAPRVDQGKHR